MRALSHEVAAAIATRITEIVPYGFKVVATGPSVTVFRGDVGSQGTAIAHALDASNSNISERLEHVALEILSVVQDRISEFLQEPWPTADMLDPRAEVRRDTLTLGYGDERTGPALVARHIKVADLGLVPSPPAGPGIG